ncbi:hypothetical protein LOC68_02790 [Blastopirellula sp. JC732]|uniref:Condensation domain-containing protein n=1 Tax=Blastopirellula sediminis TaxID=2894196 RepID=A0A9X1SE30_9BACT|nr:hypothetical protein [Blastopirellula sediminis]MCC9607897.1 hypothetical protein [Blastopirellula sediminis]MCC9627310.1 hypothetical protein [Blastopirellula sediminis]
MSQVADVPKSDYDATLNKIFPLPLSPVEKFMFADGRTQYPMFCDGEARFQGTVERGPFEEGLQFALDRAPIFRSVIEQDKKRGLVWRLSDRKPDVDWGEYGEPYVTGYDELIDLTKDVGLRIYVRSGSERSTVMFHFHHACADGVGIFAFIEDFLTGYNNATPGAKPATPRKLEPERLLNRCNSALENPSVWQGLCDVASGIASAFRFFADRPLPLTSGLPVLEAGAERKQSGPVTVALSNETTVALRRFSTDSKVTLNDLLLRDLFLTLHEQIESQGYPVKRRQLRVLMPQNLRGKGDNAMPTTNDVGFAFLTRRGDFCQKPEELRKSLAWETSAIRGDRLSRYFIGGLAGIQSVGAHPWIVNGRFCFATAVLTNLGNSWRRFATKLPMANGGLVAGNLVYDSLIGLPPVRPRTAAAFSVTTTADQIYLSLKQDQFQFTRQESTDLLKMFAAKVTQTAELAR